MSKPNSGEQPQNAKRGKIAFENAVCFLLAWVLARQLGLLDLLPFARGDSAMWMGIIGVVVVLCFRQSLALLRGLVIAVFGLWLIVAFTPLASLLITPLKLQQTPQKADAVVVLQAGIQKDNDFSTPTLERTLHALELIHEGYTSRLLLTENKLLEGSHEEAASRLMRNLGLKATIFTVGPVQTTHDEAVLATDLIKQHDWKKILLVTSPSHSTRGTLLFQKLGVQVISSPCQETDFDFENLGGENADGRMKAFAAAMRETVGLWIYKRRGWI